MQAISDYSSIYKSMPIGRRKMVLRLFQRWGGWTKTTSYRKMAGESLTPLEKVMVDGIFSVYMNHPEAEQLEISFEWDEAEKRPKIHLERLA